MKPFYYVILVFTTVLMQLQGAIFTVTSNADAGANTLRQAILDANAAPGADIIQFNFGAATTITLTACQTAITGPLTIDGYSNPGASAGNLMILIISPAGCRGFDFAAGSDGSVIRGLVLNGGTTGIYLRNSNAHTISGNYIGTNLAGTAVAANRPQNGIHANTSNNNVIGGTGGQLDRNIISGNSQTGIRLESSTDAVIVNNYIGTDHTGNVAIANGEHGVYGYSNSHNPRVGGTTNAEMNVISANVSQGIYFNNCLTPVIKGNIIGMGLDGTTKLGNGASGINCEFCGACQIGGLTTAERNYISCNGSFGAVVRNSPGSVFEGNWIGVDKTTGLLDYGNYDAAITATNSADVRVGGSVAGSGNVLSASGNPGGGADGISIWSTSPRPIIKGNIIGLGIDGVTPLQNYGHGIECLTCDDGIIGGPTLLERNLIACSFNLGMQLVSSPGLTIVNNYIGTDISGTLDRGGTESGIHISNSSNVTVGGTSSNLRNLICGNAQCGIDIDGTSSNIIIKGNYIGLGSDGTTPVKNDQIAIKVSGNSTNNITIGGATIDERNLISSNGTNTSHHAIFINGTTTGHSIVNNYIGVDVNGNAARGNFGSGLYLNQTSGVMISDNIISNNGSKGIELASSSSHTIIRNIIGTDISNTMNMGNAQEGIRFSSTSSFVVVGGSLPNANIIANNNNQAGVLLESNAQRNTITFNSIYCNTGLGIDLQSSANETVLPPGITTSGANSISGTGTNGNVVHVYRNVKGDGGAKCNCEGEIYLGMTTVAGGVWSLTHNLGLSAAEAASVTATQTTPNGSTSEFSPCTSPLPVELLEFYATRNDDATVNLFWTTVYERNNHYFEVQRSEDGIHFAPIEKIPGAGNSLQTIYYQHSDGTQTGIVYYRLKQVDYDGLSSFSHIIAVLPGKNIILRPESGGITVLIAHPVSGELGYTINTLTGSILREATIHVQENQYEYFIPVVSESMYFVKVVYEQEIYATKILNQ